MQLIDDLNDKYTNFKKWINLNGCKIHESLQIPSNCSGHIGVSTLSQIPTNKTILAVPQKLILTAEKVYKNKELKHLFAGNDDLFDYEACDQNQFNILAVFLMYQKSKIIKAKKQQSKQYFHSFWQPYFESASDCSTMLDWPQQYYSDLPKVFRQQIIFFQIQMLKLKLVMKDYLSKTKQFQGINQNQLMELFQWAYRFVMTRCFGECFTTTSLIPVVDMFNHGNHTVQHQLLNINKQKQQQPSCYHKFSGILDLGILDLSTNTTISSAQIDYIKKHSITTQDQLLFLSKQQTYDKITQINKQLFYNQNKQSVQNKQIYAMQYLTDDDRQDNDSDNQQQQTKELEMKQIKMEEQRQIDQFKKEFQKFTISTKQNQQTKTQQISSVQLNIQDQLQQKAEVIQQTKTASQTLKKQQTEINIQQKIKENIINKQQTKENNSQESSQDSEQTSSNQTSSQQSDDSQSLNWHSQDDTYFILHTLQSIKPNTQLFISYGSRTNKFLLIWYGFCYPNNQYDSVSFRIDAKFENETKPENLIFQHYYLQVWKQRKQTNPCSQVSRQFRLKRTKIDQNLIMFLRVFLMNQYKEQDRSKLMGTLPCSINFQIFLFTYMIKLFHALQTKYPSSKIKEWRQKQANPIFEFKAIFYEEQLKIINQNILMAKSILDILMKVQQNRSIKQIYKSIEFITLRKIRRYIKSLQDNIDYINYVPNQKT